MYLIVIMSILIFLPLPIMVSTVRKTNNGYKGVFEGVLSVGIATMMMFILASSTGNSVGKAISLEIQSFSEKAAQTEQIVAMLGLQEATLAERVSTLTQLYSYVIDSLPAMIIICSTVLCYFEYKILVRITKDKNESLPMLTPFSDFTMPKNALWGWVLIYIMAMATSWIDFSASDVLQINVQLLFQFAFMTQGAAVLFYYFRLKKLGDILPVILCLIVISSAMGQMLLCLLGFIDLGFDLRKRMK